MCFAIMMLNKPFLFFLTKVSNTYKEAFPLKTGTINYKSRRLWLSDGLKKCIEKKNKLYKLSQRKPSNSNILFYKRYKNKLISILRQAEKSYYQSKFSEYKNNMNESWKLIKEILKRNGKDNKNNKFIINNEIVTSNKAIAQAFNKYYVNIGSSLASQIENVDVNPKSYIKNYNTASLFLEPVTEVLQIMKSLKDSSPGWDEIKSTIIKKSEALLCPLTHICNCSLLTGVVPLELKVAKVIPLFKGGDNTLLTNSRPVSVLQCFSKIFEKIMYDRLLSFIKEYDLLYEFQFDFRHKYSTCMALTTLVDRVSRALDNNEYVIGVFLDFSKAFDTVNYPILYEKLKMYGIRGTALDWIKNYLSSRKQFVTYNNEKSECLNISCGVPQGSILGPLLFLLYVNDIANISNVIFPILFADDTNVFISGENLDEIMENMNAELDKFCISLKANKLSLNVKTHFMNFKTKKKRVTRPIKPLKIMDENVDQVTHTKFLGVIVDQHLDW